MVLLSYRPRCACVPDVNTQTLEQVPCQTHVAIKSMKISALVEMSCDLLMGD
jgi:hypothetical protein